MPGGAIAERVESGLCGHGLRRWWRLVWKYAGKTCFGRSIRFGSAAVNRALDVEEWNLEQSSVIKIKILKSLG